MSIKTRLLHTVTSHDQGSNTASESINIQPCLALFNDLDSERYPYLLSSTAQGQHNARYDIVFAYPQYSLTLDAEQQLCCSNDSFELKPEDTFFSALDRAIKKSPGKRNESARDISPTLPLPYYGGWFIYLAYEMAQLVETCLTLPPLEHSQPMAVASRCPAAIIYDRHARQLFAVAEGEYEALLDEIEVDYRKLDTELYSPRLPETIPCHLSESDETPYLEQVEKVKKYIVDGDIFQANLSRLWQGELLENTAATELFISLSQQNPSSFAAIATFPEMNIISSSPERLVSIRQGVVETRPIAGTRPRDKNRASDTALADELLSHPKEQAEHIMLIDLERNDLGRVCTPGTIVVNELMVLESWQHVHHIVSNVRGELKADKTPVDVIKAVFPGGTITGCPKVRCMEILAEMEQQARGAYTGSLGYINTDGSMDLNILIRTLTQQGNKITFRAGGGIVSDSVADRELAETRAKAKGLLKIFN